MFYYVVFLFEYMPYMFQSLPFVNYKKKRGQPNLWNRILIIQCDVQLDTLFPIRMMPIYQIWFLVVQSSWVVLLFFRESDFCYISSIWENISAHMSRNLHKFREHIVTKPTTTCRQIERLSEVSLCISALFWGSHVYIFKFEVSSFGKLLTCKPPWTLSTLHFCHICNHVHTTAS